MPDAGGRMPVAGCRWPVAGKGSRAALEFWRRLGVRLVAGRGPLKSAAGVRFAHPQPQAGSSVAERFPLEEDVGGSSPSRPARFSCPLRPMDRAQGYGPWDRRSNRLGGTILALVQLNRTAATEDRGSNPRGPATILWVRFAGAVGRKGHE